MALSPEPNYPSKRQYVLKLHRDALAASGLNGRLENMLTGPLGDFHNAEQLLALLANDLASGKADGTAEPANAGDRM